MGALTYRKLSGTCGQDLTCPAVLDETEATTVIVVGAFLPADELAQLSSNIGPGSPCGCPRTSSRRRSVLTLAELIAFVGGHFASSAFRLEVLDVYEVASDG